MCLGEADCARKIFPEISGQSSERFELGHAPPEPPQAPRWSLQGLFSPSIPSAGPEESCRTDPPPADSSWGRLGPGGDGAVRGELLPGLVPGKGAAPRENI